jgi:hypothetical protein
MSAGKLDVQSDKEKTWPNRLSTSVRHRHMGISLDLDNGWLKERQPLGIHSETILTMFPGDILVLTMHFCAARNVTTFLHRAGISSPRQHRSLEAHSHLSQDLPPPIQGTSFRLAISTVKEKEREMVSMASAERLFPW